MHLAKHSHTISQQNNQNKKYKYTLNCNIFINILLNYILMQSNINLNV